MTIRVVIIDDHRMLLESLVGVLSPEPDIEVVATASSVASGVKAILEHHPDVIVLDQGLAATDGVEPSTYVSRVWPAASVLVLTPPSVERSTCTTAHQLLEKTRAVDSLAGSIRATRSAGSADP